MTELAGLDARDTTRPPSLRMGDAASGPHRCAGCGYGVASYRALPRCPMCGGAHWRPASERRVARGAVEA